jgi:hypothetical protein
MMSRKQVVSAAFCVFFLLICLGVLIKPIYGVLLAGARVYIAEKEVERAKIIDDGLSGKDSYFRWLELRGSGGNKAHK